MQLAYVIAGALVLYGLWRRLRPWSLPLPQMSGEWITEHYRELRWDRRHADYLDKGFGDIWRL